jgi:PhnB protein
MAVKLNPYLNFPGKSREALTFYHEALGGKLDFSTFKDFGAPTEPEEQDFIMHGVLESDHITIMSADMTKHMPFAGHHGFALSLQGEASDEAKLRGYWDKLSVGGEVTMPLEKAQWGDTFGMFTDKYGVGWMVNIAGQ